MIKMQRLLKVTSAWISVVYVICYGGVLLYPSIRPLFMRYALHADVNFVSSYLNLGYFVTGLVIWNGVALAGVGFFVYLYNNIKK